MYNKTGVMEMLAAGVPVMHKAEALALFPGWESGVLREKVAAWAATGSLPRLSSALVFDGSGIRDDLPEYAYDVARDLIANLESKRHQMPGDSNLDFRTHFARVYDDGIDVEGGDTDTANQLQEAALRKLQKAL